MIEADKIYVTRNGYEVMVHAITLKNATGELVTFPVKGSWYDPKKSKRIPHYDIWRLDGRNSVFGETGLDIVGEKPIGGN